MIARSQFNSPAEALANVQTWEEAVDNVVEFLISQGQCFSSGEVVSHIRTHRSDLRFKHAWVGERLQTAYAQGTLPSYDMGPVMGETAPVQVTRQTSGLGRTPAGINVFVYGPDQPTAAMHHFEVDVPLPGPQGTQDGQQMQTVPLSTAALAMMNGLTSTGGPATGGPQTVPTTPPASQTPPVVATGKQVPGDVVAKVHADGRVCIPRLAFEALAHETGIPVVGGKALYATWNGLTVEINQQQGLSTIYPTTDFCRVHLTPPSTLPVGKEYAVKASAAGIRIDFSQPL